MQGVKEQYGLTAGALGPSIVSLNTKNSTSAFQGTVVAAATKGGNVTRGFFERERGTCDAHATAMRALTGTGYPSALRCCYCCCPRRRRARKLNAVG